MKKLLHVLLFVLLATYAGAQQSCYKIRNFLPKEYNGFNQTWQAVQDESGLLYVASSSRIHVYDGVRWTYVTVRNGAAVRQLAYDSAAKRIYVGSVGSFGYLERNSKGLRYVSISDSLDEKLRTFGDVWKLFVHKGKTYFQVSERIYIVTGTKLTGTIEGEGKNTFALAFQVGSRLFVRQRNVGLMEIVNDKPVKIPGGEIFASERLLGMCDARRDGKILVLSGDRGIWEMYTSPRAGGSVFSENPVYVDTFLVNAGVLGLEWVNDSTLGINSRSGLGLYSKKINLKEIIGVSSGMNDESIPEIFVDREKKIWMLTNNGITRFEYNSNVRLYSSENSGFTGITEMLFRSGNKIYLASAEGAYISDMPDSLERLHFTRINTPMTEVWDIGEAGGKVLAATSYGLFDITDGKSELLYAAYCNTFSTTSVPGDIVVLEKDKISFHHFDEKGKLILRAASPPHVAELIYFSRPKILPASPGKYSFWAYSRFHFPAFVQLDTATGAMDLKTYDSLSGLPNTLTLFPFNIGDSIYFIGANSTYRYIPAADKGKNPQCFSLAPDIHERIWNGNISQIDLNNNFRIFFGKTRSEGTVYLGKGNDGKLISGRMFFSELVGTEAKYLLGDGLSIVWTVSADKLMKVNLKIPTLAQTPYHTLVRSVRITKGVVLKKDSLIIDEGNQSQVTIAEPIAYSNNSLHFKIAAPFFEREETMTFVYELNGDNHYQVDTSQVAEREYQNLPEGDYTLTVHSYNIFMKAGTDAVVRFTILPPWYRSGWAYFLYVLLFILVVFVAIRISVRRLRAAKIRLEKIVTERTAEVVQQKQQLEIAYTDIRDSINYAKRIQEAILPSGETIQQLLPGMFTYFRPRDVVSGDFYWFVRRDDLSFVACVDCTGHGVPGAFMSMIGNTLLNEIIVEKRISEPDEILNLLHLRVRQALKQDSGGETRDGMDLALVVIDHKKKQLRYAGANRSLLIVRQGNLLETKPDKMPIGGMALHDENNAAAASRIFKAHTVALENNDMIYMTTDGYADQFGGEHGKKMMVRNLNKLLTEIASLPETQQARILEEKFVTWKGHHEQVDDVLVMGIRYTA